MPNTSEVSEVINFLNGVANKLGTTTEFIYSAAVRKVFIEGCLDIVAGTVILILTVLAFKFFVYTPIMAVRERRKKAAESGSHYSYSSSIDEEFMPIVITLSCLMTMFFAFHFFYSGVLEVAAPEYIAAERLLRIVR